MKKILMGLIGISTISLAALDLGAEPTEATNIFQTGQTGRMLVKGTVSSEIPIIKYAVFASANGTIDDTEDVLTLPDMVLSFNSSKNILEGTPKKIYVKRVVGGALGNLIETDNVSFLATGWDESYVVHTGDVIELGRTDFSYPMTSFISKAKLTEIAGKAYREVSGANPTINDYGEIEATFDGERRILRFPNGIGVIHEKRGVLELKTVAQSAFTSNSDSMTEAQAKRVLNMFSEPVTDTVYFQVKIN